MIDIAELVDRGYESKDLDYKGRMAWDEKDKKACCEIVKDCLAMANTPGDHAYGHLVIGVSELASGFSVTGLSEQQAESWDTTRFNNFLKNYADPPINTMMRKGRIHDNVVVVIDVPRFAQAPHMCKKDYPGVLKKDIVYVRTDSNESAPATNSDMSKLFQSVRQQPLVSIDSSSQYQAQIEEARSRLRRLLAQHKIDYNDVPLIDSMIHLSEFQEKRISIEDLERVAEIAYVDYEGWKFPVLELEDPPCYTNVFLNDCIETFHLLPGPRQNTILLDYWRLYTSGLLFHSWHSSEETIKARSVSTSDFVSMTWLAFTPGLAAKCLVCLLNQYANDTDVGILNIEVLNVSGMGLSQDMLQLTVRGDYFCAAPTISEKKEARMDSWRRSYIDFATDISLNILLRFQFSHLSKQFVRNKFEGMFS